MSRPPSNNSNNLNANFEANRGRIIDFVQPLQSDYALYAQAGFPGYEMPNLSVPYPTYVSPGSLAYSAYNPSMGSAYSAYNPSAYPLALGSQAAFTSPSAYATPSLGSAYTSPSAYTTPSLGSAYTHQGNNSDLHQKIETKIESIMQAQKAEALQSRVDNLTEQVRTLSRSIEMPLRRSSFDMDSRRCKEDSINSINSKLQQLAEDSRRQEHKFA